MNKTIKRIIIGMVIVVIAFLFYMIFFDSNKYVRMEKNLIKKAKEYVLNNNISTDKEIYLDVQMINYELDEDCSIESGVLYDGDSYKSYLLCNNYESKILDNNSNIKLLGKVIDVIPKGVPYIEEGFISDDEVVVSGEVKDSVGVYNLEYKSNLNSVIRKVIVVDNEELYSYYPKMTIKGNENVLINKNDKYIDEGAEAFDVSGIIIFLYEIQFGPFQISSFVIAHICFQLSALIKRICMISITGGTGRTARISRALDTVRVLFQDRIIVFSGFSV